MSKTSRIMTVLAALVCAITMSAQTDCTSYITNPSVEKGTDGWEHKGMGVQDNSVFSIKDGSKYMERWTGRGGAVGNGRLAQKLTNLPPGNYELSVAAQNIQEDTPQQAQTGAWIFAETSQLTTLSAQLNKTTVTVRNTYKVAFNFVSGSVTIGFIGSIILAANGIHGLLQSFNSVSHSIEWRSLVHRYILCLLLVIRSRLDA